MVGDSEPISDGTSLPSAKAATEVRARRWRPTFLGVLRAWTALLSVSWGAGVAGALRSLEVPWGWLLAAFLATVSIALLDPLILSTLPDRRRPRWRVAMLELPYLVHWCAAHVALAGGVLAAIVGLVSAALGWTVPWLGAWPFFAYLAGLALALWGVAIRPRWTVIRRFSVPLSGLGPAMDDYVIAHLSDLHIGSYCTPEQAARWVALTNRQGPDLVVITGDLVSSGVAFHRDIARVVGLLKARDGVIVIPGNHDYFGHGEPLFGLLREAGVRVLRNAWVKVERDGAQLVVAGVDDLWTRRADLGKALRDRPQEVPTVLLAHDPAHFPAAAARGVELVLSGHTHGGQIAVPFLARWLNLSHWAHRYQLGLYRQERSTLYVSGGLGTTGPPIRIGVAPEIAMIHLRAQPGRQS